MAKTHRSRVYGKSAHFNAHGHQAKRSKEGGADGYPTHNLTGHPPPPHLTGSGNKADGLYGKVKDSKHEKWTPGRGKGNKYVIEDGSRTHHRINVHPQKKHHSKPGHTEMRMFRHSHDGLNHHVPHAFRAHHQPHSGAPKGTALAHGPMAPHIKNQHKPDVGGHNQYSPLRFSGHPGAHQVGKLSSGRTHYKDREAHHWGKPNLTSAKALPGNPNSR